MKVCWVCKTNKPLSEYHKSHKAKDGLKYDCKSCRSIEGKSQYKKYYTKNRDSIIEKKIKWGKLNRDKVYARSLERTYGITLDDYNRMFSTQNGVCAICDKPETYAPKGKLRAYLCVDHNHTTGKVRGLLCNSCNKGIASFNENPKIIENAIKYVEMYKDVTDGENK